MHKTIIFKILGDDKKVGLKNSADECLTLFGKGARKDPIIVEETFDLCNTPIQNGYTRVVANDELKDAVKYMRDQGYKSKYLEVIRIEEDGQTEFVTAEYDDPEFGHVRELLGYMAELPIVSVID